MKKSVFEMARAGLMSGAAVVALSGAAVAADLGGGLKDGAVEEAAPGYTIAVNGGLTTDYVFRGFSQSDEGPAVFAGADFAYEWFYAGVWASSIEFPADEASVEVDVYAGIKKSWQGLNLDLGVIYYAYPDANDVLELDYVELKAAIGTTIADTLSLTGTVYYSPDYTLETGEVWTLEAKASAPLPIMGLTLSGTVGTVLGQDDEFEDVNGFDEYVYWNIGLSKTFKEHFTVDVRYWDTDVDDVDLAEDRIVGTISFAY